MRASSRPINGLPFNVSWLTAFRSVELGDEISSLACNHRENGSASLCAVAFWKDISVAVLEVPSLMLVRNALRASRGEL